MIVVNPLRSLDIFGCIGSVVGNFSRLSEPIHRADHAAFGVIGHFQDFDAARVDDARQVVVGVVAVLGDIACLIRERSKIVVGVIQVAHRFAHRIGYLGDAVLEVSLHADARVLQSARCRSG